MKSILEIAIHNLKIAENNEYVPERLLEWGCYVCGQHYCDNLVKRYEIILDNIYEIKKAHKEELLSDE